MSGTALLHGALQSCRKCILHNFSKTPSSKVIFNRLHSSANRRNFHQKSYYTVLTQSCSMSRNVFSNKRYFSVSYTNNAWFPWFASSEPPVVPKNSLSTPNIPPPQDTVTASSVPESVSSSVDVASDPGVLSDVVSNVIIDPPFTELGLATKWFPNHFVHELLEFVHLNTGLEWWSTIIIGTVVIRLLTIPLFVLSRKTTINMQNYADEIKKGHEKLERYKYTDDAMRLMVARKEMRDIYKETGTGPFRTMLTAPSMSIVFITCVMALRQMVAVPVPSFVEGGVLWFTDLSMPDPYYALPIMTGGVMGLYIHTLLKSGSMPASYKGIIRKAKYLPIVLVPLILGKSSSAIFLYWLTTSIFSLTFVRLLQIPGFKEMLRFPELFVVYRALLDSVLIVAMQIIGWRLQRCKCGAKLFLAENIDKAASNQNQSILKPQTSNNKGLWETMKTWKNDSYDKTYRRMQFKEIKKEQKRAAKEQKKILKGKPPVTYEIGVDAMPTAVEAPDFEREWRPSRPKPLGHYIN